MELEKSCLDCKFKHEGVCRWVSPDILDLNSSVFAEVFADFVGMHDKQPIWYKLVMPFPSGVLIIGHGINPEKPYTNCDSWVLSDGGPTSLDNLLFPAD